MTGLLSISDLRVDLGDPDQPTHVLRGVELELPEGEAVGLVGESGSGKTTTMLAAAGLLPPSARIAGGSIRLGDRDLLGLGGKEWREVRGRSISCIFQNARGALHPMMTVGDQVARAYRLHHGAGRTAARREAVAMLSEVGLPDAERMARRYPHQLSGGQCQRAMIAMALITKPQLVLADEPTSGLDVTVQRQVLATLVDRAREHGTTMLLISHDVGVIRRACERVAVMYAGEVVEQGSREAVLERPAHPYTQALLASLDTGAERMAFVAGSVPDLRRDIRGCPFVGRCPHAHDACHPERPPALPVEPGHTARCVLVRERGEGPSVVEARSC